MKPIPGRPYTIVDENTLSQVAARAYGDGTLWPRIWSANQTALHSGDPDIIFPGETILIPILPERQLPTTPAANKNPDAIFFNLDGREIQPVSASVIRTIDTVANGFAGVIGWQPGEDIQLDAKVAPKQYTPTTISIGGEKILTGVLYSAPSKVTTQGTTLTLNGGTATMDLVDSILKPPLEKNNITLDDRVREIVEPLGFKVIINAETGGKFDRTTATNGETIAAFLLRLTRQRGVLLTCDEAGNILVTNANTDGSPVATLEEGITQGVTGWGINVDGRKMFNVYRATGRSPLGNQEATVTDNAVPRSRFKTIPADEMTAGDINKTATWARNKTTADALSFQLTVEGWRDPQGQLWKENTIVTIVSKSMFLSNGFNFLINRVEYILDNNGRTARLSFVPPTVYTQGEIVEPW